MNMREGFALALRQIRNSKNLTQEDFSEVSSRTYLSSLERAMKSPTLDKVGDLSSVLDVHPMTLLMLAYCYSGGVSFEELYKQVANELNNLADI